MTCQFLLSLPEQLGNNMKYSAIMSICWMIFLFLVSDVFTEFYAGRIKPGKFEYPKMNGWMLVEEAKTKCENDLACGGFTFKGSYKTLNRLMEIYFFHIIPSNKDDNYFYWSTYKVNRNFVKLPNRTVKYGKIYSQNYTGNYLDMKKLTNMGIVAIQPLLGLGYTKIDFSDFIPSNNSEDGIILNLKLSNMIDHTFPKVDRCCKTNGKNIDYDGIDNIKRIDCNISRKNFTNKYVNRREPIMVKGCQTEWKASNWTIENLLDRYEFWPTFHQKTINSKWSGKTMLKSNEVKNLIESGHFVKIFPKLPKNLKGWTEHKATEVKLMLDLIDEYSVPRPMPEDEFYRYHVDTDQAYFGIATAGTGSKMHVDTVLADAFNSLIRGKKWWVVLPKDLYEFREEYSCDPKCSEPFDNFQRITGVWFTHILPQIRNRIFYGQKLKSCLQKPGETLYMPNMIFHTVWNISPTVVLGDGLLYETSFDEWIGSGFPDRDFVRSRILLKAKGYTKVWLDDMINQIDEAIENYKIVDYARPKIDAY